ncbi:hypothetical protein [Heliorestis convoluta]|uniref:Uncharacterized protein n=1 Tax=Heliorestis convoluta TaxID=356322 RepID=A0A5Q2MWT1_9FIRM|nr:hypothetical protein [Heliorestis convoluta]QGG46938.1 hypothetical protein FTV88_0761 [Heliorestis convoluta]
MYYRSSPYKACKHSSYMPFVAVGMLALTAWYLREVQTMTSAVVDIRNGLRRR